MDLQHILSKQLRERFGGEWTFKTRVDPLTRRTFVTICWYRDGIGVSERTIKESELAEVTEPRSVLERIYQAAVSLVPDEAIEDEEYVKQMLEIVGEVE